MKKIFDKFSDIMIFIFSVIFPLLFILGLSIIVWFTQIHIALKIFVSFFLIGCFLDFLMGVINAKKDI